MISFALIKVPLYLDNEEQHVWHVFVIETEGREKLQNYLNDLGIQTIIHYPIPPHKQKAYKEYNNHSYPIAEKIHNDICLLSVYDGCEKGSLLS